jgi:cytochrome c biogenesis protein CcmG/thiol:disulfide interchange protein DsbE
MRRWLAFAPLLALAALIGLMAVFALNRDPQVKPDALVGQPLPQTMLPTLTGGEAISLRAAVEGPTVVNIFASWCGPCEIEHPQLMGFKAAGVRVVGLAYKDDPVKTAAFLQRLGDPFAQVLTDQSGRAAIELGASGVPETFLVGSDGIIRAKHTGPLTPEAAGTMLEQARSLR